MGQQSTSVRPSVFKRHWFQISGAIFLLLIIAGGVYWWTTSGRVTATALFKVESSLPSVFNEAVNRRSLTEYEFETLKRTQIALAESDVVLTAALRDPKIGSLPILQDHADPVQWLKQNLTVEFPQNGAILSISLRGDESQKKEIAAIVDAISRSYWNEAVDQERQQRLVTRDLFDRNLRNLNEEIRHKLDEYLDIARETGKAEAAQGQRSISFDQELKRLDRIEDELMRFENQLAIDLTDTPTKAKLIKQRVAELQKNRDELYGAIAKQSEISTDLDTRKRDLDCLRAISVDMATRLQWLDIDANSPDRIRQVQAAIVSPQSLTSRFPATHDPIANSH